MTSKWHWVCDLWTTVGLWTTIITTVKIRLWQHIYISYGGGPKSIKTWKLSGWWSSYLPVRERIIRVTVRYWKIHYKTPLSFIALPVSNLLPIFTHTELGREHSLSHNIFAWFCSPLDFKEVFTSLFVWHKAILKAFPALTSYSQACRFELSQSHLNFLHKSTKLLHCLFPPVASKCRMTFSFCTVAKSSLFRKLENKKSLE